MSRLRLFSVSLVALIALSPALAFGQDDENGEPPRSRVVPFDRWNLKPQLKELNRSMQGFSGFVKVLGKANKELAEAFQAFADNPKDELLAARVEYKLARYAAGLHKEFQAISGQQDVMMSSIRGLNHKIGLLTGGLGGKSAEYTRQYETYAKQAKEQKALLIKLADQIKNNPPENPQALATLKNRFAVEHRRYKLSLRYKRGYGSRLAGYRRLKGHVGGLKELFGRLEGQFQVLVDNLENERKYLRQAMELQADGLKMKRFLKRNIESGENALLKVATKLEDIYKRVDVFTQVHEKLSASLDTYGSAQGPLNDLVAKIGRIGQESGGDASLDKLIDSFAKRDPNAVEEGE